MKEVTLTYEEVTPSSGKGKPWGYYISEQIKHTTSDALKLLNV